MRDDRFPEMDNASLEQRLAPLLSAAPPTDARWLRNVLADPESHRAFGAIDAELFLRGERPHRAIAVVSAARGEGRTTLAILLGAMAAASDAGRRVLLVDADIERGRLGEMLGIAPQSMGLRELMAGRIAPQQAIHASALPNLSVVPRGVGAALAFAPRSVQALLDTAAPQFDLVVVDTPAGSASSAALLTAKLAGSAVMVLRYRGPTHDQAASFLADLNRTGTEVVGCVMNRREYVIPAFLYGQR